MKQIKKLVIGLVMMCALSNVGASATEAIPTWGEKSVNSNIEYHWCIYSQDCDDNCIENGYSFITVDEDGEAYVFDKTNPAEDDSNNRYLVITKGDIKNVIQVYQVTNSGLVHIYSQDSLVPRNVK